MLTVLLGNSLRIVNSSIDHQAVIKKESITPLLDSALSIPLFERDLATLNELLEKLTQHENSEFTYIVVYDDHENIFSERYGFLVSLGLHRHKHGHQEPA